MPEFVMDVLRLADKYELQGLLRWRCDGEYAPISFWIICNDEFWWGTADGEDLTPDNLPILRQSIQDCIAIDPICGSDSGCSLFAARMRGMRPQGACYPQDERMAKLFDACGPEREVGLGNPYRPGEYKNN